MLVLSQKITKLKFSVINNLIVEEMKLLQYINKVYLVILSNILSYDFCKLSIEFDNFSGFNISFIYLWLFIVYGLFTR